MLGRTPFLKGLEEELRIRRPNPRAPYRLDVRGAFSAIVRRQSLQLNTDLNINLTDERYNIAIDTALPLIPETTGTYDQMTDMDLQKDDHLIRLKFLVSSAGMDADDYKNLQANILQIVNIEASEGADAMLLEVVELGSL